MSMPNVPPPVPGALTGQPVQDWDIDWDTALKAEAEGGYQPVPDGEYLVKAIKADVKPASTGSPMIVVQLQVCDGGPYNNKVIRTNFVYKMDSTKSMGMFANKVVAFGLTREWLASARPSLNQIAAALIDRMARAAVSVKKQPAGSKNEYGNEINRLSPASGVPQPGAPSAPPVAPAPTPTAEAMAQVTPPVAPAPQVPATPPVAPTVAASPTPPVAPAPAPAAPPAPAPAPEPAPAAEEDPFIIPVQDWWPQVGLGHHPYRML